MGAHSEDETVVFPWPTDKRGPGCLPELVQAEEDKDHKCGSMLEFHRSAGTAHGPHRGGLKGAA